MATALFQFIPDVLQQNCDQFDQIVTFENFWMFGDSERIQSPLASLPTNATLGP
jgi:hypothetical protein